VNQAVMSNMLTRTPQVCGPFTSCCTMFWEANAGETLPLQIDWSGFVGTVPGFALTSVESAEIIDLNKNPPGPADDTDIKLVSGMQTDPTNGQPGFAQIIDGRATEFLVWSRPDLPGSRCYRLDICLGLIDCHGRRLQVCDCVNISINRRM